MTDDEPIRAGHLYGHDDHGEVYVSRISAHFKTWDPTTDAPATDAGALDPTVRFYTEWDDYGPATFNPAASHTEPASEFATHTTHIGEKLFNTND